MNGRKILTTPIPTDTVPDPPVILGDDDHHLNQAFLHGYFFGRLLNLLTPDLLDQVPISSKEPVVVAFRAGVRARLVDRLAEGRVAA